MCLSSTLLPACRSFAVLPADWSKLLAGSTEARGVLAPYFYLRGRAAAARLAVPRDVRRFATVPDMASDWVICPFWTCKHLRGGRLIINGIAYVPAAPSTCCHSC